MCIHVFDITSILEIYYLFITYLKISYLFETLGFSYKILSEFRVLIICLLINYRQLRDCMFKLSLSQLKDVNNYFLIKMLTY